MQCVCMCGVIYVHVCANAHVEARECQVSSLSYSFVIKSFTELGARGLQLKSLRSFHPYSTGINTDMQQFPACMWVPNPNLGPYTCAASALMP